VHHGLDELLRRCGQSPGSCAGRSRRPRRSLVAARRGGLVALQACAGRPSHGSVLRCDDGVTRCSRPFPIARGGWSRRRASRSPSPALEPHASCASATGHVGRMATGVAPHGSRPWRGRLRARPGGVGFSIRGLFAVSPSSHIKSQKASRVWSHARSVGLAQAVTFGWAQGHAARVSRTRSVATIDSEWARVVCPGCRRWAPAAHRRDR
jgi:hypothetical protein